MNVRLLLHSSSTWHSLSEVRGTSLADADRIRNVARRVVETHQDGNSVVVVVSAMGKSTDDLIGLANQISKTPHPR